jgi:hypothetical protein
VVCWDLDQVGSWGLEASLDLDPVGHLDPALVAVVVPVGFGVAAVVSSVVVIVVSAVVTEVSAVEQAVQEG